MKKIFTRGLFLILCLSWFATAAQAFTTTTNYSFQLPQVNNAIDQDQWGGELNTNFSNLDSLLLTATNKVSRATTTTDSITSADQNKIILANATGGAYAENLPAASSVTNGFLVIVKKTDSSANAATVTPNGMDTIDGAASFAVSVQYGYVALVSDHVSNWNIVSQSTVAVTGVVKTVKQQVFASGGTYTPATGMLYAQVEVLGGGGGGGGATGTGAQGGGGGAGSYSRSIVSAATMGSSQTVTVGAAGVAGISSGGTGGTGGASSVGSIVTANGGLGGAGSSSESLVAGGAGGAAGTGTVAIAGATGGQASGIPNSGHTPTGGNGANSIYGGGGPAAAGDLGLAGLSATGKGAGGGGGWVANGGAGAQTGGAGTIGIVIITEYCSQ